MLPLLLMLAADPKPEKIVINDPAKLKDDKDFAVQGEYASKDSAVQLIARGKGNFDVRYFAMNGLPGKEPLMIDNPSNMGSGTLKEGSVSGFIKIPKADPSLKPLAEGITFKAAAGQLELNNEKLERVERNSPTLGAKPPAGAIVLFDKPEDLKNWDNMKVVELSDGKFLSVGGRTKQKFQSFTLHLEFRLPWMPNSSGQGRGNSGVYLQDRYEVQVLDSFGLEGKDNECGGIYKESKPKVNMCFPPMTWQTYDIDFTAAKFEDGKKVKPATVTVKHNGVVIHDKLELKNNTPGGGITKEVPEPGSLYLQNHGDPVVYRNVWIVEK